MESLKEEFKNVFGQPKILAINTEKVFFNTAIFSVPIPGLFFTSRFFKTNTNASSLIGKHLMLDTETMIPIRETTVERYSQLLWC